MWQPPSCKALSHMDTVMQMLKPKLYAYKAAICSWKGFPHPGPPFKISFLAAFT